MNPLTITLVVALCANGVPVKRMPDVTYGGLKPQAGYARDHLVPLCAGGPDSRDNVWYEPYAESKKKDALERLKCEAICRGEITEHEVWQYFLGGDWRKDLGE